MDTAAKNSLDEETMILESIDRFFEFDVRPESIAQFRENAVVK